MTAQRRARRDIADRPLAALSVESGPLETETSSQSTSGKTGRQTLILENFPSTTHARALSPNGRVHWRVRNAARSDLAAIAGVALNRARLQPVRVPVRLRFRYVFPDKRLRDVDNLTTGVTKVVIDSLVRAEVLAADDSEHVTEVKAEAVVEKGQRRLVIVIEEV